MIVVDTSVWIDFFRDTPGRDSEQLEGLIRESNRVAICGVILQEILQGIKSRKVYETTRERLLKLPFLDTNRETYLLAAAIYRELRIHGITVPSTDVTIAAICVSNHAPIYTRDEHFMAIGKHSQLALYSRE
ncbi:MAG: PIN domain nuclease [Deltaproteobacteria bacterium]|nr:PIN domain nuclease [Deltaproteobacteria bacterium]